MCRRPFLPFLHLSFLSLFCFLGEGRARPLAPLPRGRRPRTRDGQPLISKKKEVQNGLSCSSYEVNNTVCIINKSVETDSNLQFAFEGDVKFDGNITVTSTNGLMKLDVGGNLSVGRQVKLAIHGDILIIASGIHTEAGSVFESQGVVKFTAGEDPLSANARKARRLIETMEDEVGFHLHGLINCSRISLHHLAGIVFLHEGKLMANSRDGKGLEIVSRAIRATKAVSVQTPEVTIEADGDAFFEAIQVGGDPQLRIFQAYAGGDLHVGGTSWTTLNFIAAAHGSINIAAGTLKTTGTISSNELSSRTTRCDNVLDSFPSRTSTAGEAARIVKKLATDSTMTFDFVVASKDSIVFEDKSRLIGASMFVCALQTITMSEEVLVDASWRGCGPDNGKGAGYWNSSLMCAGGGSNFGLGGSGAQYDSFGAASCANPGHQQLYDIVYLPTQSAAGGACSGTSLFATSACPAQEPFNSYGGGLIWISGASLNFRSNVVVRAEGQKGKLIGGDHDDATTKTYASGGGSGGQILIWAGDISLDGEAILSVKGGDVSCTTSMAGGAGGGGFVGIGLKNVDVEDSHQLTVKTDGGAITDDCKKQKISDEATEIVNGNVGIQASLFPCVPGHSGIFCGACPVGTWNSDGGRQCFPCTNMPKSRAEYISSGASSAECPYRCVNGVPSVVGNRDCLSIPEFVLHFFGGSVGFLCILLALIVFVTIILWRRSRSNKRALQGVQAGRSFNQTHAHAFLGKSDPSLDDRKILRFSKEQLPYHICRIFLVGSNTCSRPWALDGEVPEMLEPLIMHEYWSRFVSELANRFHIPRNQRWFENFLRYCYPPAAPLYALKCRRKRMAAVLECVHAYSEGTGTRDAVWKPLRVRFENPVNSGTSILGMAFGCDSGATLGYIDFFDFNRSQLDFAPIDLRQEVRVMATHGDGSYLEPYALDPADPLLQHLGQMGCGLAAVYSVVAAFNWNARRVKNTDLHSSSSPALEDLKKGVDDCAARCGLGGLVQVIVSRQLRAPSPRSRRRLSKPRDIPSLETSFSDFCRGGNAFDGRSPQISPLSNSTADMSLAITSKHQDLKLCLAFADCDVTSYADLERDMPSHLLKAGYATNTSLTSPMPRPVFGQYLAATKNTSLEEQRKLPFWRRCSQQAASWALNARVSSQRNDSLASPATAVLVILIVLLVVDVLLFILMAYLVSQYSIPIFLSWLLIPPLAGPLAIIMGPIIVLTENARLARMYVITIVFSLSSTGLILVILTIANKESWIFHLIECLAVIGVKAILVVCANAHIASLESAQDLSFAGSLQVDAASGMILSGEPSSGFPRDDSGHGTLERLQRQLRQEKAGIRSLPSAPSDSGFDWDETRYVSDDSAPVSPLNLDRQRHYTTLSDMAKAKGTGRLARSTDSDKGFTSTIAAELEQERRNGAKNRQKDSPPTNVSSRSSYATPF